MRSDQIDYRILIRKWVYGYSLPLSVIKRLGIRKDQRLVLVGSGIGQTSIMAAKKFKCKVLGLESSKQLVEVAEERAARAGLSGSVSFRLLSEHEGVGEAEALFFESVLSFVDKPAELIKTYVKDYGIKRVGVLELVWTTSSPPSDLVEQVRKIFGEGANFMHLNSWPAILNECGLHVDYMGTRKMGLARKFWDDFKAEPLSTLTGLTKTLYKVSVDHKAKEYMDDFRLIFKLFGKIMSCAYYVSTPRMGDG